MKIKKILSLSKPQMPRPLAIKPLSAVQQGFEASAPAHHAPKFIAIPQQFPESAFRAIPPTLPWPVPEQINSALPFHNFLIQIGNGHTPLRTWSKEEKLIKTNSTLIQLTLAPREELSAFLSLSVNLWLCQEQSNRLIPKGFIKLSSADRRHIQVDHLNFYITRNDTTEQFTGSIGSIHVAFSSHTVNETKKTICPFCFGFDIFPSDESPLIARVFSPPFLAFSRDHTRTPAVSSQ